MADTPTEGAGLDTVAANAAAASLASSGAVEPTTTAPASEQVKVVPTDEHREAAAEAGLSLPEDLSKVSDAKAKELVEAGVVTDSDVPGKMYRRKADKFLARIPSYTWNAYADIHKELWDEVKLTTDAAPSA